MVTQGKSRKSVKLTFNHAAEGPVFVAGTFNNWSTQTTKMKKLPNGSWEVRLQLPPGEHQFRYYTNGRWFTDYAADGVVPNGLGDFNSVLTVPQTKKAKPVKSAAM